jgi:hypothetical protein
MSATPQPTRKPCDFMGLTPVAQFVLRIASRRLGHIIFPSMILFANVA